ncbi:glutaredoxin family protein [Massilia phyllosphaerae]|uniref:glutaredoxin family protein n=1 Tax=Massilia phyllosphaerae TaxID=3106034 RepID=UPI002B1CB197|nr:glutaredoxin family protein [Massilia sp. SGZ-792]
MFAKTAKNVVIYGLILVGGLAVGRYLPQLAQMVMPKYQQGDFAAYYPDAKTRVVVYGTETCPYCAKARAYLKERQVAFGDFDVAKSEKGKQDFAKLGGKAVPVILIGDRQLVGFNQAAIDAALDKIKSPAM